MAKVLIVDDQENQRRMLAEILAMEKNHAVFQAAGVDEALAQIAENHPDVVLTDLKMPGKSGLSLLEKLPSVPLAPEAIIITAFGSIATAIEATKLGAYDYLTKPVSPEKVLFLIEKAAEKRLLRQEACFLREELERDIGSNLIAESVSMRNVVARAVQVAATDSTVLIRGETGTGKECIARLIHLRSPRGAKPLRTVNCASFSETLLDSELFGYEKGAFTGANVRKIGIIESASDGTIFLDEVGDMTPGTQAKILRALQEKEIRRVGGTADIAVDVRIIAATNKDLEAAIKEGLFREDLYYRLNVVPIDIPPLRDRREDIPALFNHFLSKLGKKMKLSGPALDAFMNYKWTGNARELKALAERISIFSQSDTVTLEDIPPEMTNVKPPENGPVWDLPDEGIVFENIERHLLSMALEKAGGNMTSAAKLLGMSYRAFRYRANTFGIREE